MKAHEKKKWYRLFCAKQIKKGAIPDAATGNWNGSAPNTTVLHLRAGFHANR